MRETGKSTEAVDCFKQTQARFEKLATDFPARDDYGNEFGHCLWHLSDASAQAGRHDEAEAALRRSL